MNVVKENANENSLLKVLRDFSRDKIKTWELEEADPLISHVNVKSPRGNSMIFFTLNKDEVFEIIGLSSDSQWIMQSSHYEMTDAYQIKSDYEEGYIYLSNLLEGEALQLRNKLASILFPGKTLDFSNSNEDNRLFNKFLINNFEEYTDDMFSDAALLISNAIRETLEKKIDEDFSEMLEGTGFSLTYNYELYTTVGQLILLIREQNYNGDIMGLIDKMLKDKGSNISWEDNTYVWDEEYLDENEYNTVMAKFFSDVIGKISEDPAIIETIELADRITKKFSMEKTYDIPKKPGASFEIKGFVDNKIMVMILTSRGILLKNLSEENFYNLLYQLELFDII